MRISDWSSDVCSSDLLGCHLAVGLLLARRHGDHESVNVGHRWVSFVSTWAPGSAPAWGRNLVWDVLGVQDRRESAIDHALSVERHVGVIGLHPLVLHDLGPGFVAGLLGRPFDPAIDDLLVALRLHRVLVVGRSEEHTSELQSLMRISYAVFC